MDMERDILSLVEEIAGKLPGGWAVKERCDERVCRWANIRRPDGAGIHLGMDWREKKLCVSGCFPRAQNGQDFGPYRGRVNIGVSPDRGAEAIARDIARRFLPLYLEQHEEALKQEALHKDAVTKARAVAVRLAKVLNVPAPDKNGDGSCSLYLNLEGSRYGTVQVGHGGAVQVDLHGLDGDTAARVLTALAGKGKE